MKASRGARRCGRKKDAMGMKLMKDDGIQTPSRRVSTSAGEQVSQVPTLFAGSAKRMGHGSLARMGMRIAVGLLAIVAKAARRRVQWNGQSTHACARSSVG